MVQQLFFDAMTIIYHGTNTQDHSIAGLYVLSVSVLVGGYASILFYTFRLNFHLNTQTCISPKK